MGEEADVEDDVLLEEERVNDLEDREVELLKEEAEDVKEDVHIDVVIIGVVIYDCEDMVADVVDDDEGEIPVLLALDAEGVDMLDGVPEAEKELITCEVEEDVPWIVALNAVVLGERNDGAAVVVELSWTLTLRVEEVGVAVWAVVEVEGNPEETRFDDCCAEDELLDKVGLAKFDDRGVETCDVEACIVVVGLSEVIDSGGVVVVVAEVEVFVVVMGSWYVERLD